MEEIKDGNLRSEKVDVRLSEKECEELFKAKENELPTLDIFDKILYEREIKIYVKNSKSPLSSDKIRSYKDNFIKNYLFGCKDVVEEYENEASIFDKRNKPIKHFIENINNYLQNP